ncbi:MAG: pantoate--beta-alanine ligase [Candidatus Omnitrophota bacterium]|nr:pantoate--beta-alanine ligase [Candidatus Omnitrophota bacterium]
MRIIRNIKEMAGFSDKMRSKGKAIGFVPTMGALHEGHSSLIRRAHKENDIVVVSIFVNPIQFGPKEDYRRYPRNLKHDARLCQKAGADVIFCPEVQQMYHDNYKTYVIVENLSDVLCGKFRPGHFKGVATIVTKFFNIVRPHKAYFGQKDAQQAIIIKKIAEDLNIPVRIKVMPTVREKDGLAMSSRNTYLNKEERLDAKVLYQALILAKNLIKRGYADSLGIIRKMRRLINKKKSACIQYISIVNPNDLQPIDKIRGKVLITLSAWIGKTRLIDNIIVNPNDKAQNPK